MCQEIVVYWLLKHFNRIIIVDNDYEIVLPNHVCAVTRHNSVNVVMSVIMMIIMDVIMIIMWWPDTWYTTRTVSLILNSDTHLGSHIFSRQTLSHKIKIRKGISKTFWKICFYFSTLFIMWRQLCSIKNTKDYFLLTFSFLT